MTSNDCLQRPCKNGATCIDLFGKFQCICPDHFEGETCTLRVDECAMYAGTHAGCQNNATCTNDPSGPGFFCSCAGGYHGHLCQYKSAACDGSSDLCGEHGHCMASKGGDQSAYKCFCEWGYRVSGDPKNPTCVDVDECQEHPCYPGASCVNLPGTFKCTACPAGMIGNGVHCHDFDECADNLTNGCSKDPPVECINTFGSYKCGACPEGYEGDGYKCQKTSRCAPEKSPCHPVATCHEEPTFHCQCPAGMIGDGLRRLSKPKSDIAFKCHCSVGYVGPRCEYPNPCKTFGYCRGHGRCVVDRENDNYAHCECQTGYFGTFCQFEEDACGFHSTNDTGQIYYETTTSGAISMKPTVCTWYIQLFDTRKVLVFHFKNFMVPTVNSGTARGCRTSFANLSKSDGPNIESPEIDNFCHGDALGPDESRPFYTSSNSAVVRLSTRLQSRNTLLHLTWKAVPTRCGGRHTTVEGRIDYYDVHVDDNCVWYISVPPQYHIEVTVDALHMISGPFVNCSVNALEIYDSQAVTKRTRISRLCESQDRQVTYRTSGPYATIHFRLDIAMASPEAVGKCSPDKDCQIGFTLSYKTIELPEGCGGELIPGEDGRMEGYIESPNYPHPYFPNLDCYWVLNASRLAINPMAKDSVMISVEFEDFDVPATITQDSSSSRVKSASLTSCDGDYVEVTNV
ncbi:calcium binding EGF domain-containing protein [Aphelenchoides avenae]|nr:calcium binding EGF domain-containing protein [Aphelenchus avenae]